MQKGTTSAQAPQKDSPFIPMAKAQRSSGSESDNSYLNIGGAWNFRARIPIAINACYFFDRGELIPPQLLPPLFFPGVFLHRVNYPTPNPSPPPFLPLS